MRLKGSLLVLAIKGGIRHTIQLN